MFCRFPFFQFNSVPIKCHFRKQFTMSFSGFYRCVSCTMVFAFESGDAFLSTYPGYPMILWCYKTLKNDRYYFA